MVTLCTFTDRIQAEHLRSILEAEGIPAWVNADDVGGWRPDYAIGMGWVKLQVAEEHVEAAMRRLREAESAGDETDEGEE